MWPSARIRAWLAQHIGTCSGEELAQFEDLATRQQQARIRRSLDRQLEVDGQRQGVDVRLRDALIAGED